MIAGALAAVALPGAARPQRPMHRLGILRPTTAPGPEDFMARRIPASLRQLGYVEGQNLEIIARYAQGRVDRLPALARELLERQVDAIVAVGSGAVRAAMDASARVPVVMFGNFDPVAVMLRGNTALVRESVVRCVQDGGRRSFSGAGCEIPDETPHENLLAQAQALRSLGRS